MEEIAIVEKIKSGPYWRVNFRPYEFMSNNIASISEISKLLEQSKVSLRGWDFPHINDKNTSTGQDFMQSEYESKDINEFWRFYKSGQFIHYFSVYEDYHVKSRQYNPSSMWETASPSQPSGYVGITTTLFRMTEIYEFAMRLAQRGVFDSGITISITLSGIKNYKLFYFEAERILLKPYISQSNEIKLESKFSSEELIAKGHDEAIEKSIDVFELFSWIDSPKKVFIEDQSKFLERRL